MLKRDMQEQWAKEHLCVSQWLKRVMPSTRGRYLYCAYNFFQWLKEHGGEFRDKTPEELLDLQDKAHGRERFKQLQLIQEWVNESSGRKNSKSNMYVAIRSFYAHNYVPLPKDITYEIKSDSEPVDAALMVEELKTIILSSDRRYKAIFLCMFQSGMGENEFEYFNLKGWEQIGPQLKKGNERLKIHLPGRKHARNERPFYTFIGKDGVEALKEYLEEERGPIRSGEPIFLNDQNSAVNKENLRDYFKKRAIKAGVIKRKTPPCPECGGDTIRRRSRIGPKKKGKRLQKVVYLCKQCGKITEATKEFHTSRSVRYGINVHEMRDTFRSEWDIAPAKGIVAEFLLGHQIDVNSYDKFYKLRPEWVEEQYALAEPYLNILSEEPRKVSIDRVRELENKVEELERRNLELKQRLNGFTLSGDQVAELLRRIEKLEKQAKAS